MFPSECVLERHVRLGDDKDFAATDLKLFILDCKDRKADGYADDELEIYNQRLKDMVIGVRLADAPPAVSYLAILGSDPFAEILAVDKTVIVISLEYFTGEEGRWSYLIYDAVALSLRMIPAPEDPSWRYALSSRVSLACPCRGSDYALVHTCRLDASGEGDFLGLWRPSSSSPPWSEYKMASLPDYIDGSPNVAHTEFSFNGYAYWVDLLCGVSYCRCDTLFDANSTRVKFGGYIGLPVGPRCQGLRMVQPDELAMYRTMGVVRDSFIRFVSINGFHDYVELKDRTMTVWKLLGPNQPWEEEHKLSLETLWGFEGFGDLPKDLTPMYPLLSTKDTDVVYLVLGEYSENRFQRRGIETGEIFPLNPCYMLALDMRNKIVRTVVPLEGEVDWCNGLISCSFSRYLRKALVGPCDDEGIPMKKKRLIPMKKQPIIPMKKQLMMKGRLDVAETSIPIKKQLMMNFRHVVAEAPIPMTVKNQLMKNFRHVVAEAPILMKKRRVGRNVADAPIPMKKPRLEKLVLC